MRTHCRDTPSGKGKCKQIRPGLVTGASTPTGKKMVKQHTRVTVRKSKMKK